VTRDYLLEFDDGLPAAGPPQGGRSPSGGRREASWGPNPAPLLSVWGGKITTFRKLAEEAADLLVRRLGERRPAWTETALFPGGNLSAWIGAPQRPDTDIRRFIAALAERHPQVPAAVRERWARCYGGRVVLLLQSGHLGAEVAPGLFEAELDYLYQLEWARCAEDVLWRRTKLGLHMDAAERARVADWWLARHPEASHISATEMACN
jgi:glycerol-3-phosphate dehydrogenase